MKKKLLTTGDIAKHCNVNFRTVVRWIERGHLKSHKLPGRGDNRIQIQDFITFLKENDMPIPDEFRPLNQKILLVDDDPDIVNLLKRKLKSKGFEIKAAKDGFSAGVFLQSFSPAVMILDLKMPGLSGLDMIKSVRNLPGYSNQKILVLSGASEAEIKKAMEMGADDYMQKPADMSQLVDKILQLIEK
ncbi:response regulator [Fibrobacterota bacterium]